MDIREENLYSIEVYMAGNDFHYRLRYDDELTLDSGEDTPMHMSAASREDALKQAIRVMQFQTQLCEEDAL